MASLKTLFLPDLQNAVVTTLGFVPGSIGNTVLIKAKRYHIATTVNLIKSRIQTFDGRCLAVNGGAKKAVRNCGINRR